jgi:hypothetical protein
MGEPFNPFGLFARIFVPEALVRAQGISPGAKLTYRRLARYAGQEGNYCPNGLLILKARLELNSVPVSIYRAWAEGVLHES